VLFLKRLLLRLFLCADDGALNEIKLTMQNNACLLRTFILIYADTWVSGLNFSEKNHLECMQADWIMISITDPFHAKITTSRDKVTELPILAMLIRLNDIL
jgi:hypothetical protein